MHGLAAGERERGGRGRGGNGEGRRGKKGEVQEQSLELYHDRQSGVDCAELHKQHARLEIESG